MSGALVLRVLQQLCVADRVAMSKRKLDADEPAASGGSKPEAAGGTEGQQKPSLAIFVDLKRARAPKEFGPLQVLPG